MHSGGTLTNMLPEHPLIIGPWSREQLLDTDVVGLARQLLGTAISTTMNGITTAGIITETEAYAGVTDRASHAYGGRRTARTSPMYAQGGTAYVYLCYGIHHLFNVVTGPQDVPQAVLVRAIIPWLGIAHMEQRFHTKRLRANGPGTLSKALGIHTRYSGTNLDEGPIRILRTTLIAPEGSVRCGPRVGVEYAGDDALLPYRFRISTSQRKDWLAVLHPRE